MNESSGLSTLISTWVSVAAPPGGTAGVPHAKMRSLYLSVAAASTCWLRVGGRRDDLTVNTNGRCGATREAEGACSGHPYVRG